MGKWLFLAVNSARVLFLGLDPQSVPQQLAYYELYPKTEDGQAALQRAWDLLGGEATELPPLSLPSVVNMLAKQEAPKKAPVIGKLGKRLKNRALAGSRVWSEEEVLALDESEVDVGRGLLISLFETREEIENYEALLDLMALQVLCRTSFDASDGEKIRAINRFLFEEQRFRFPPHSLWVSDVDEYTFLPTILDSRRGVCLGVSTLYLCIAQRIGLELEAVTPPGHIYLRCGDLNIETTARGIHLDSERYLSIHTKGLKTRTKKEVIGLTFFNQASALWQAGKVDQAVAAYRRAEPYLPDDPLLHELMGYTMLLCGEDGWSILEPLRDYQTDEMVAPNTLVADLLDGKADVEAIGALFLHVDEDRESILTKQRALAAAVKRHPDFRDGRLALATTHLQLGRQREAIEILRGGETGPVESYYLAALNAERSNYPAAWSHLAEVQSIMGDYQPRALKELERALRHLSPK